MTQEIIQHYTCPMHDDVHKEQAGMCPHCGMTLAMQKKNGKRKTQKGRSSSEQRRNPFVIRFWVSVVLSIPIVLYSGLLERFTGWTPPALAGAPFVMLALGSIVFFYGGWVFLKGARRELGGRAPGMMTLIGLAIVVAYGYSVYEILAGIGQGLLWELATLIAIMLLGHWMEMRAVQGVQGALDELAALIPDVAEVVRDGTRKEIPVDDLRVGDHVIVRPGGSVPIDGTVVDGRSSVNEALVTGESTPVTKEEGDSVVAGAVNGDGVLEVAVTKVGDETFLAGVQRLIAEAQQSKSRLQNLSDRAAFYLTIIAVAAGAATFIAWILVQAGVATALERTVAVLVIACPHALGLAIPLVAVISTTMAARQGFLVRDRLALERARTVDVVLFDKTGTLTEGNYGVDRIWAVETDDESDVLSAAAAVDQHSEHFVARAIVEEAEKRGHNIVASDDFQRIGGKGVRGTVDGRRIFVGGWRMLEECRANLPRDVEQEARAAGAQGKTIIVVHDGETILGALALADGIRQESREAVDALHRAGIAVAMITGDSEAVAAWVADELGIDDYFAEVLPEEKVEKVKTLQGEGKVVAMVGDGINDAPALTQADVGIAIGAGTNVAIESAGVILAENDPRDIVGIVRLSAMTYRKMVQNLFWAAGYNVVAIPLAAGVLATKGIVLQPALGALLMSLSTVIVAVNALTLRRQEIM